MDALRVVLVIEEDNMRMLARAALEADRRFSVVGERCNGAEAVTLAGRERPDIVLLDLELPWLTGAEAVPLICADVPECFVALWTVEPEGLRAYEAMALGASAVIDRAAGGIGALAGQLASLYEDGRPSVRTSEGVNRDVG